VEEDGFGLLGPRVPGAHPQQQRKQGVGEGHRQVILILLQVLHCSTSIQLLQQNSRGLVKPTVIFKCCMATETSVLAAIHQGFCETHCPLSCQCFIICCMASNSAAVWVRNDQE